MAGALQAMQGPIGITVVAMIGAFMVSWWILFSAIDDKGDGRETKDFKQNTAVEGTPCSRDNAAKSSDQPRCSAQLA